MVIKDHKESPAEPFVTGSTRVATAMIYRRNESYLSTRNHCFPYLFCFLLLPSFETGRFSYASFA